MYGKTDGMIFLLNNDTHEASLIEASGDVTVPKMVVFESVEYKVTCIKRYSLSKATSLDFPPDSELETIGSYALCGLIESMTIPANVKRLGEGWSSGITNLKKITVNPNNRFFRSYEDKIILRKSTL